MFCALADQEPEVMKYINKYVALAPIVYLNNTPNALLKTICGFPWIDSVFNALGINRIFPYINWVVDLQVFICGTFPNVCKAFFGGVMGGPTDLISYNRISDIMGHAPGGTSKQNLFHF
jgi:hypothetical protein